MASKLKIKVNGLVHSVTASLDTPLLYVLHNELHLHGPRFGCGLAQCGACSVLLDGKEIRSCVTPVAAVSGKAITTLEGLPALWAKERGSSAASPALHPLQHLSAHPDGDQAGRHSDGEGRQVMTGFLQEQEFSRRTFAKAGGALIVGFSTLGAIIG